jgi:hypothetical protein
MAFKSPRGQWTREENQSLQPKGFSALAETYPNSSPVDFITHKKQDFDPHLPFPQMQAFMAALLFDSSTEP